jgi:ribosomal protein S27E
VDDRSDTARLIRCRSCHTVYAEAEGGKDDEGRVGCPECGERVWIAVDIPVQETGDPTAA